MTSGRSPKNNAAGERPRKTASWRGLILQLLLVTVLPLTFLLIAFTFGSLVLHQQAMRTLVGERDERAVRTAASAIAEQVHQRLNTIRLLSVKAEGVDSSDLSAIFSSVDFLQSDFDYGLAFFGKDGKLEAASGDPPIWHALQPGLIPYFQKLFQGNETTLIVPGTVEHPQTGDAMVLVLAVDPARQRVTAGSFSAAALAERILGDALSSGNPTSFILVDNNQRLLYRKGYLFTEAELISHSGVAEALRGESGTTYQRVGDSEHVVAYSPVETLGWGLISEEPWEMVDTPMLRTTQAAPLVLVPVLVLALLALWFAARQIIRPLQELETKSVELAGGDFQSIEQPVGGIAEIRHLQAGLVHMAHKVNAAQQSLHNYIGAITAAQEDERRRLARELHDDTIQALIALKQRVQLAGLNPHEAPTPASLDEISALTEQTIENLRRLTRALRPIYLEDLGLTTALEMLARETGQAAGIPVEFSLQGEERRLPSEVELAMYRIAQEALSNVARHAQASYASLGIDFLPQKVTLQIIDDGLGFEMPRSPAEFAHGGHFGLLGLYERADLIGANLQIDTTPDQGTRLTLTVHTSNNPI